MAFNRAPSNWLTGYSLTTNSVTVNTQNAGATATFPELTNVEANASSGDIRKIVYAVIEQLYQKFQATPAADRPNRMSISRSSSVGSDNTVNHTYVLTLGMAATGGLDVADESA
jgi:hypothetical protein